MPVLLLIRPIMMSTVSYPEISVADKGLPETAFHSGGKVGQALTGRTRFFDIGGQSIIPHSRGKYCEGESNQPENA